MPLVPGDTSIPEKRPLLAVQQVSQEFCHPGRGDSKFSARTSLSLSLLDLLLCIKPLNRRAQVDGSSLVVHSNEAYKNSK